MKVLSLHPWDVSFKEARQLQVEMSQKVKVTPFPGPVQWIAGCDVSFLGENAPFFAAVVIIKYPEGEVVEKKWATMNVSFPYVPGFLSFREVPVLLKAFEQVTHIPDLIFCDGQGRAHPKRLGLASHLGLFLDRPTIGCGKSRLVGEYSPVAEDQWAYSHLLHQGEQVGVVLRTRAKVKPLFISPGHQIDIKSSIHWVKECTLKYRLPLPIRLAHQYSNEIRRQEHSPTTLTP